ncbi:UDP-glucose:GDP-mannose dehydrogenase [Halosimplex carlsbadense 2-9-1]|uniref:UDP-N-acetyl-D-mannosamine dehydrogenase n=1 Tax=Halosimplex carlsbadense 2-9-1 TaxID=797114 RepID=M0CKV5_9EURY|nr:nucleotide sugar dehydrogenase [Halosimplex carlsbadense]ELZ22489.1 UDP-glucose:GDP-mannose dehydrogenase [Halosimplex carlsbadense 2-9-1]
MSIGIYGVGFVGKEVAELAVERGRSVACVDVDPSVVERIEAEEYLAVGDHERVSATTDGAAVAAEADTCLVTVPTPVDRAERVDLGPLRAASETIAEGLRSRDAPEPCLVVVESTIPPGTARREIAEVFDTYGLELGTDYYLAAVPERVDPGNEAWPLERIPRVVGALSEPGLERATAFYDNLLDAEVHPVDSVEIAEVSKIVENAFRDINIAFANEIAVSLDSLDVDARSAIEAAATKPFGFMSFDPGAGVGGHCIPVDPHLLIGEAEDAGFTHELLTVARTINSRMPEYVADMTVDALTRERVLPQDATALLLGRAFKPDLADDRNSPYFGVREGLADYDVTVETYDPILAAESSVDSPYQPVDAVVVVTDHEAFADLDPERFAELGVSTVVDGRDAFDAEAVEAAGLRYEAVGEV